MDWTMLIGPVAGILIVVIDRLLQRRKVAAETREIITRSKIEIDNFWHERAARVQAEYGRLELKVDGLGTEVRLMKRVVAKLWQGILALQAQLAKAGINPCWVPDEELMQNIVRLLSGASYEAE